MAPENPGKAAGPLFFGIFAVLFLGGACAMWPGEITAGPLSEAPGAVVLRALGALAMGAVGLEFLGAFIVALVTDD